MGKITITATGGTTFQVHGIYDTDDICGHGHRFLGSIEFGDIDADGQWVGDDDALVRAVREMFGIADDVLSEIQ